MKTVPLREQLCKGVSTPQAGLADYDDGVREAACVALGLFGPAATDKPLVTKVPGRSSISYT